MKAASFVSIGECMIELSAKAGDLWRMSFAGDTFNSAWYARAILPSDRRVSFVTAVGDDPFSERMRRFIAEAGIETDRVRTAAGRRPGLYAITLHGAERAFSYWRGESAARRLADDDKWLGEALRDADLLYFSGITLAILPPKARTRLLETLKERRAAGTKIAFDPNFRPALWPSLPEARAAIEAAFSIADVGLPTFDDGSRLFGDTSPQATAERVAAIGVNEIVVKNGSEPCLVVFEGRSEFVPPAKPERIIDTTGAGDSFCGAYLGGRLTGRDPINAARLGHLVAAEVVGVHGALARIDRRKVPPAEAKRGV